MKPETSYYREELRGVTRESLARIIAVAVGLSGGQSLGTLSCINSDHIHLPDPARGGDIKVPYGTGEEPIYTAPARFA